MKDNHVGRIQAAGLNADVIYSIGGGDGEIWLGRQQGGLTMLTGNGDSYVARTYTQADGLAQNSVTSVHRSRDGAVWAGTVSAGISRLKDGTFQHYAMGNGLASNEVDSIVEGHDGTMWFASPNGLESYSDGRWVNRAVAEGLPALQVRTIFEDSAHVLWVATSGGLACLSSGHVMVPSHLPELLREQIFGIAEDSRGFLWFATSDHVLKVSRDKLFAGTLEEADLESYGAEDGLEGVEGVRRDRSIVSDALGRIWVSVSRGLAVADPKLTLLDSVPVVVRIESITADGMPVDLKDVPKLDAGSESIAINYAGANLSSPERVRYRYELQGSDRGWGSAVALRQVIYNHLGPGSYHFRVTASKGEGLWNGPEATADFVIKPALSQTWWFRTLLVLACLLTAMLVYHLRMYQITLDLNARFQERLAERTRIAQDLHDTLLQGFLSASMQLDVVEDKLPEDSPEKPALQRILRLMSTVTEEGRVALRGLRRVDDGERNLELAFSRMRQELAVDEQVGYRVIVQSMTRPIRPFIRDEVYRIGREAVVNAFLHSQAQLVEVEVEYASKYLRVLVRDDGCGIDAEVLQAGRPGHWGLPGMRERSERIGASLKLRSRVGAGTEVELNIPSAVAFEDQSQSAISRWLGWLRREK